MNRQLLATVWTRKRLQREPDYPLPAPEDLFAHFSDINTEGFKSLKENEKVSFDVKMGPKSKHAANIKPV